MRSETPCVILRPMVSLGAPSGGISVARRVRTAAYTVLTAAFLSIVNSRQVCAAHDLSEHLHAVWTQREGVTLPPINCLAQSTDGYLWLGTSRGLWRFDGQSFARWATPGLQSEDVRSLAAARTGGLWIGTAVGISRLSGRTLVNYASRIDLKPYGIRTLIEDPKQSVWAGSSGPKAGGLWILRSPAGIVDAGLALNAGNGVNALFEDRAGILWIGTQLGLYRLVAGKVDNFPTAPRREIYALSEDRQGRLLVSSSDPQRIMRFTGAEFEPVLTSAAWRDTTVRALVTDDEDGIWGGTFSDGLWRIWGERIERFGKEQGLSGSAVQALMKDRDGNIWVGTRSGLDRFRHSSFSTLARKDGLSEDMATAVATSRDGSVWVGTATQGLNRITRTGVQQIGKSEGLPNPFILSVYEDVQGRVWVGTLAGLAVGSKGRFTLVPARTPDVLNRVTASTGGANGRVWVSDGRRGLYTIDPGGMPEPVRIAKLPSQHDIYALLADRSGRLWAGYYHGSLVLINDHEAVVFNAASGLAPGSVVALYEDRAGTLWVGSSGGLSRYRNGVWTAWTTVQGLPEGGVQTITGDDQGGLWLTTEGGIYYLALADIAKQKDGEPAAMPGMLYGAADGFRPQIGVVWAQPRVAKAVDGSLWFATEEGVVIVDPSRVDRTARPPAASVDEIRMEGEPVGYTGQTLELKGKELVFRYSAPSLTSSAGLRFRYRLRDFDRDWVIAGVQRQARYTNIAPGSYEFQVAACNNHGFCADSGDAVRFVMLPAFYQTWWFRLMATAAIAGILWAAYRARVHALSKELAIRLEERFSERARIARELHDTLLQNVIGISLQLDSISRRLSAGSAKSDLERMRQSVDASLREARESVQLLREKPPASHDLSAKLREAGAGLTSGQAIQFSLEVRGEPCAYSPEVEAELLRIGREAVSNSVRHSGGSRIEAMLVYERRQLRLEILDNGKGFEEGLDPSSPVGHFGISGMRERAEAVGATVAFSNQAGAGALIRVTLPRPRRHLLAFLLGRRGNKLKGSPTG